MLWRCAPARRLHAAQTTSLESVDIQLCVPNGATSRGFATR